MLQRSGRVADRALAEIGVVHQEHVARLHGLRRKVAHDRIRHRRVGAAGELAAVAVEQADAIVVRLADHRRARGALDGVLDLRLDGIERAFDDLQHDGVDLARRRLGAVGHGSPVACTFIAPPPRLARGPHDQNAMRIDLELLAGKHHGRGAELLDHGGSVEPEPGGERRSLIDRRLPKGALRRTPAGCRVSASRPRRLSSLGMLGRSIIPKPDTAEIDELHLLLAGIVVAEGLEMGGVERSDETLDERTADRARGRGDAYLHGLAGIAHVGFAHEPDARTLDAVAFQGGGGVGFQTGIDVRDSHNVDGVLVHDLGHDVVGAPVDGQQSEGGKIAGIGWHDAGLHPDQLHHRRRLRRAGAAEREQREFARIDAALDGHLPDGIRLVPVGDLDDAFRELFRAHVAGEPRRERGDAGARAIHIEANAAADQRRRDAAHDQIGIGDGRLVAAIRVAHGAGLGAGTARPDLEMTLAADPGDRAATRADGLDVDHRDAHRERTDGTAIGHMRLGTFDQAEIGRGAAGVQGDHIGKPRHLGNDRAAERAGGRPRQRRGDRFAHHLIRAGDAAARLHHQERLLAQAGTELVADAFEIAAHMRFDEGVDEGRHRALILAVFRQHVAGERDGCVRVFRGDDLGHAALVRRIGVGMQQTDTDRLDALLAKEPRRGARASFVERAQLAAEEIEPAADLAHVAQRHDALRLHPEIRIAVALGHRLAGDFQDVAEAFGDDEAEPGDLSLQQRIGCDRRAVRKPGEVIQRGAAGIENGLDAANETDGGIGRGAGDLGDAHLARGAIDADDIGEGAAGVDADPKMGV